MRNRYPLGPRVKIHVTKELITKSIAANSTHCMIAEAIKLAYPKATTVHVDIATCRFSDLDKELRYVYITPFPAQKALLDFDEGKPVAPFSCILKNAHVTKAGQTKPRTPENATEKKSRKRRAALLMKQTLRTRSGGGVRIVGGKRPPQLRVMRKFGVRLYRGASTEQLLHDAELVGRAEAPEGQPQNMDAISEDSESPTDA